MTENPPQWPPLTLSAEEFEHVVDELEAPPEVASALLALAERVRERKR